MICSSDPPVDPDRPIRHRGDRQVGFSLIEVQVAFLLFAVISLALVQTLIASQAARQTSAQWMRATQLAEERLEQVRAGDSSDATVTSNGFTVSSQATAAGRYVDVRVVAVTVAWTDRNPHTFVLRSLVGERP